MQINMNKHGFSGIYNMKGKPEVYLTAEDYLEMERESQEQQKKIRLKKSLKDISPAAEPKVKQPSQVSQEDVVMVAVLKLLKVTFTGVAVYCVYRAAAPWF